MFRLKPGGFKEALPLILSVKDCVFDQSVWSKESSNAAVQLKGSVPWV